jgi:antitoxin MazE
MTIYIKKWGNSASVRIPSPLLAAARLSIDDPVVVREEGGRIVIEPVRSDETMLAALLEAITPDMLHDEIDVGGPVGREAW